MTALKVLRNLKDGKKRKIYDHRIFNIVCEMGLLPGYFLRIHSTAPAGAEFTENRAFSISGD